MVQIRSLPACLSITLTGCLLLLAPSGAGELVHHDLSISLEPATHQITVEDRITLPPELFEGGADELRFVLHGGLKLATTSATRYELEQLAEEPDRERYGINQEGSGGPLVPLREYRLRRSAKDGDEQSPLILSYHGEINHPLVSEGEEYARSFARTPGLIDEQGVVLSGSTWWLPTFGEQLVSFKMTVDLPAGWEAVSQGARKLHELSAGRRKVVWDSPEPMDEVYLVAAQFTEYSRPAGEATAFAFLRQPDPNLASKYLEATAQYIEMYRKLIGPYPYGKFALVENFWDTGYGMPSFTLLGPRIIRFPFILHSSYPHEILHNWWGNSVFVDYENGNWCEGLTAYMADHLVKEGQGRGAEYRRDTLKKYSSFVRGEKDFPLTDFRSRHSSATEAVGYGKSLMLWHMLRKRIGDEQFTAGLSRIYRSHRSQRASFADFEKSFSAVAEEDLEPFFRQWVERTGAPRLQLGDVSYSMTEGGGSTLSIELLQTQVEEPYRLAIPIAVTVRGEAAAHQLTLGLNEKCGSLQLDLPDIPLRVDVDPEFDLFRRLDPFEIPPSLGQLFGAEKVTLVLPRGTADLAASEWDQFAQGWAADDDGQLEIVAADEIDALPNDRAVWILGSQNRWSTLVKSALAEHAAGVDASTIRTGKNELAVDDHCFAFAVRHPQDPNLAIGWIGAARADALPGLARKLPHYGKYSFVAFAGEEPTNDAKGQWPVLSSPLVSFPAEESTPRASLVSREPLARLAPVFDPQRLKTHIDFLAGEELAGRGNGSAGLDRAIEYVVQQFTEARLEPGGDAGTWFQSWSEPNGPEGEPLTLRNVIGLLPGSNPAWQDQSVIIGAHVDHLGHGWPDVHAGDEGALHPGADDNASGVAVLLELAELLGRELKPQRNVLFVVFSGEEWELRGSKHYIEAMERWPAKQAMAMLNLDTVGRLGERKLTIFGTGSATEWIHIVRGIGFTTGIETQAVAEDLGGSDQKSFLEAGIPAVQIFSGAHDDYHRPGDTPDKIDIAGMLQAATFTREAVNYLSEREEPLTSTLSTESAPAHPTEPGAVPSGRRVSLGTLPVFSYPGPGVKIESVREGTPAAEAGLLPGDLIVAIDGTEVADVRAYSGILKQHSPGDTIEIRVSRDGEELTLQATLVER